MGAKKPGYMNLFNKKSRLPPAYHTMLGNTGYPTPVLYHTCTLPALPAVMTSATDHRPAVAIPLHQTATLGARCASISPAEIPSPR